MTYIEDVKNPVEVRPPDRDFLFVVLRMENAGNGVPFAQLEDVPLDLRDGAEIKNTIRKSEVISTPPPVPLVQLTLSALQLPRIQTD